LQGVWEKRVAELQKKNTTYIKLTGLFLIQWVFRITLNGEKCFGSVMEKQQSAMPGVTVGENAVVGAHSFVNRDVAAGTVVAGVPAEEVRS
jgi:UDP-3-O-[3-hydroxymyristoyl] glucosamine N-acyltransferase